MRLSPLSCWTTAWLQEVEQRREQLSRGLGEEENKIKHLYFSLSQPSPPGEGAKLLV